VCVDRSSTELEAPANQFTPRRLPSQTASTMQMEMRITCVDRLVQVRRGLIGRRWGPRPLMPDMDTSRRDRH